MKPSVGRIVLYNLTSLDSERINKRRNDAQASRVSEQNQGGQVHVGSYVQAGDTVPVIVTKVWAEDSINGQAMLDGNDTLWLHSIPQAPAEPETGDRDFSIVRGFWGWPPRV